VDPVAEGLPGHPGEPCRLLAGHTFERVSQGEEAGADAAVALTTGEAAQLGRVAVGADRQGCGHGGISEKNAAETPQAPERSVTNSSGRYKAYAPILWEGPDGEDVAGDWAEGFVDAVRLRPEAWRPLLEDREALVLLMPILALCGDAEAEGGSPLGLDPEAEAELVAEAPGLIPACVVGIHGFWEEHRGRPTAGPGQAKGRKAKVGRNDPCPCGSGRKHKRCCGAH
jgi:hypothetical protein